MNKIILSDNQFTYIQIGINEYMIVTNRKAVHVSKEVQLDGVLALLSFMKKQSDLIPKIYLSKRKHWHFIAKIG